MKDRFGPKTSGKAHPSPSLQSLPIGVDDVRLVDAKFSSTTGGMSLSWWYEKVAAGEAPQPVHRAPRCTRWRLTDVVEFWKRFAEKANTEASDTVMVTAKKASAAAQAKRSAKAMQG